MVLDKRSLRLRLKYRTIPREGFLLKKTEAAYIAGFFDGDGSVRIQLQPRKSSRFGFRVRTIISFAQKIGHEDDLKWIRNKLGIGYLYNRNDGISELKIEGFDSVKRILNELKPFVLFKKRQVLLVLKALSMLTVPKPDVLAVAKISDQLSNINYATTKKIYTAKEVAEALKRYTPVTTDP